MSILKSHPIRFYHPKAFWIGTIAILSGVIAHIPMFLNAADVNYQMAGMQMSGLMEAGMYVILLGTMTAAYGLYPPSTPESRRKKKITISRVCAKTLDNAPFTLMHCKLVAILLVALIIDIMKPVTLGFVMPGTLVEYGLSKSQIASLPMSGLLGTVIGSFLWGYLGDVIGRRSSILLAALIFIGTSICGTMPSYNWNLFMCFIMGLGAGGMFPIAFSLLAEIIPSRHRGWLIVLLGGIGTIGGYLAASVAATILEPVYSWRILWLLGLPTGLILIILNRYIPESPRYLMMHGNKEEARRVMAMFNIELVQEVENPRTTIEDNQNIKPGNLRKLFQEPFKKLTYGLGLYGFAWGMVNFGFLLWLPLNLRELGMGENSDILLAQSALIAFPTILLVAWMYNKWSTKGTMILFAMSTALTLIGFATIEYFPAQTWLIELLLISLLVSNSGAIAMLAPYTTEVYPAQIRSTGSGWTAGVSKLAGAFTLGIAFLGLTPNLTSSALIIAIPTLLAVYLMAKDGVETCGREIREAY